ncbi:MAG: hypothetical protein QW356_02065 [Candidatus Hadarchaeales archaeon]
MIGMDLRAQISRIPEYELVPVAVHRDGNWVKQGGWRGVVARGKSELLAPVSEKYNLVQPRALCDAILTRFEQTVGPAEGEVICNGGWTQMKLFPKGGQVGLSIENSVNKSSAIYIKFIIKKGGRVIYAPVREYRRIHVGNAFDATMDTAAVLSEANSTWTQIIDSLSRVPLTPDLAQELQEVLDTKYLRDTLSSLVSQTSLVSAHISVWDAIVQLISTASSRQYKNPSNRERRIWRLSSLLIALALKHS